MHNHLCASRHVIKRHEAKLHVISPVFNPLRFQSRYNLFREFDHHAQCNKDVDFSVVELAFGSRPFEATCAGNPRHLQLRTNHELWHKERMINLAVQRLPSDWEYVAWVDADLTFVNPDWAHETIQQLQHFQCVQMFSHAIDIGPNMEPMQPVGSFGDSWAKGGRDFPLLNGGGGPNSGARYWHPGFAWAYRREAWETLGGMLDACVVGSGDYHMAYALAGHLERTIPHGSSSQYIKHVREWGRRAKLLKQNIGATPGIVMHHFHGSKKKRGYGTRWKILTENKFDPLVDIKNDWQGALALTGNKPKLRDELRAYFRQRNEDDHSTH